MEVLKHGSMEIWKLRNFEGGNHKESHVSPLAYRSMEAWKHGIKWKTLSVVIICRNYL